MDENGEKINFVGYIDRIDRLNGVVRVIDFKTAKAKKSFHETERRKKLEDFISSVDSKQALLAEYLCVYGLT